MSVSWKKKKNLKPEIILKRIESIRTINMDGKPGFSGFELHDALPALQSMLDFPPSAIDIQKSTLVWKAIAKVTGEITPESFLQSINSEISELQATKEQEFHLLTSLSISLDSFHVKPISNIENSKIRLLHKPYPRKYKSRFDVIANANLPINTDQTNYCNTVVTVRAKNTFGAATKALRIIDIQRGIWCLLGNSRLQILGREWVPINKIRLGPTHTLHYKTGELATEEIWFEPSITETFPFSTDNPVIFQKNSFFIFKKMFSSPYSLKLVDALLRYVRALDERDQNNAFIKIWGALESLASPDGANYDPIIRRCSFLFNPNERQYHRQILEHLREFRNQSVHSGDQSDLAKTHCYQAQFYFYHLFLFHVRNMQKFINLEEANRFLDLPSDIESLKRQSQMIQEAIRFFTTKSK